MVRAINFQSSRDADYDFSKEFSPEDVNSKMPKELDFDSVPEDKKADFMKDFARLYGFKSCFDSAFQAESSHFEKKKLSNGEDLLYLVVEHMKPSDLSMAVSNGQLVLKNSENMTEDKYKDLAKFCWMNNISDVSFPANIEEEFKNKFQNAFEDDSHRAVLGYGNTAEDVQDMNEVDEAIRKERAEAENAAQAAADLPPEQRDEFLENEAKKQLSQQDNKITPDLKKISDNMKTFLEVRSAKKKNSCYFKTHTLGGWLHYRIYSSPDQRASDGVWNDKSKSFQSNYEIDLKFRVEDDGLHIVYALPGEKEIPGKYADEIVGMMKAQGYTTVDFGNLTDADKGVFRKACGNAGLLPSFNLNEKHARSMLAAAADNKLVGLAKYKERMANKLRGQVEKSGKSMEDEANRGLRSVILECEAENGIVTEGIRWTEDDVNKALKIARDNLSDTDLLEFKKNLSSVLNVQMEKEGNLNNLNPLKKQAEKLADEVDYKPFVDAFERIQENIQEAATPSKTERAKAQNVIGSLMTAGELMMYFDKYHNSSIREFVNSGELNLEREKAAFNQAFPLDKWGDKCLKELGADGLVKLYDIMKQENVDNAEKKLERETRGKSGQEFTEAVKDQVNDASSRLKNTVRKLKDVGYRDVSIVDVGSPVYERQDNLEKGNSNARARQMYNNRRSR